MGLSHTQGAITPAAFALLLRDAATILHPPPLVTEDDDGDGESVPVPAALRALSDLHALFKPCDPRTAAKAVFYAAQVRRASAPFLRGLGADMERWAVKLEREEEGTQELVERLTPERTRGREAPRIVELS
jgi:hypothetical protein